MFFFPLFLEVTLEIEVEFYQEGIIVNSLISSQKLILFP